MEAGTTQRAELGAGFMVLSVPLGTSMEEYQDLTDSLRTTVVRRRLSDAVDVCEDRGGPQERGPSQKRNQTRGVNMSKASVDFLIERRRLIDQAIERAILVEERFGQAEDYEKGFIFVAEKTYDGVNSYTYVYLKVSNDRWYGTAMVGSKKILTWAQLVDFLGSCERVDFVSGLEEI
jgi:hypothetical protein